MLMGGKRTQMQTKKCGLMRRPTGVKSDMMMTNVNKHCPIEYQLLFFQLNLFCSTQHYSPLQTGNL